MKFPKQILVVFHPQTKYILCKNFVQTMYIPFRNDVQTWVPWFYNLLYGYSRDSGKNVLKRNYAAPSLFDLEPQTRKTCWKLAHTGTCQKFVNTVILIIPCNHRAHISVKYSRVLPPSRLRNAFSVSRNAVHHHGNFCRKCTAKTGKLCSRYVDLVVNLRQFKLNFQKFFWHWAGILWSPNW